MSDDFKVGDVVVCVGGPNRIVPRGAISRVVDVYLGRNVDGTLGQGIGLDNYKAPQHRGFDARNWRKLPPASDEFTARIRACKPHNTKVPA